MMMPPSLDYQCHHTNRISLQHTILYCLSLSTFFVASLYVFVPSSVRCLPRDHVTHIKWRTCVILGVMITGVGLYPLLFCQQHHIIDTFDADDDVIPPWYRYLGVSWQPIQDIKIALHVLILYLGALTCTWLKVYHHARILHWENDNKKKNEGKSSRITSISIQKLPILINPKYLYQSLKHTWIQPTNTSLKSFFDDEDHRWMILRNLCIAPLAEEVIFRACLLPPLLASHTTTKSSNGSSSSALALTVLRFHGQALSPTQASWIAPLFFGVAHLHHFYEKFRQIPPIQRTNKLIGQLLLIVAVQWTYTTLFGAYVSHIFIRTGSLSGVVLAHIICNYMGLPDISFAYSTSNLHRYFWLICIMYFVGICGFIVGFDSILFPKESVLMSLLQ